jgi:hypothetical protein
MSLPALALRRPVTTVAATLAFVLLGAVSLSRLPVSLLPVGPGNDSQSPPRWTLVVTLRLGSPGEESPDAFGRVAALEVDSAGSLYVFDAVDRGVRVFDSAGRFVRRLGRRGSGPGEFQEVIGIAVSPHGAIWLVDAVNARYTVITHDRVQTIRRAITLYRLPWLGGFAADGAFYDSAVLPGRGDEAIIKVEPTGALADTLVVIPELGNIPRRGSLSFPLPFAPAVVRALDARGFVWTAVADRYRIAKLSLAGDTVTVAARDVPPRRLTRLERDSLSRYVRQLQSQLGITVHDEMLPTTAPVLQWFTVADDGSLWVSRTRAHEASVLDVFDSRGRLTANVEVPFRATGVVPIVRRGSFYAVVEDPLGQPVVVRATVRKGDGSRGPS